jgi:hypothetical protein
MNHAEFISTYLVDLLNGIKRASVVAINHSNGHDLLEINVCGETDSELIQVSSPNVNDSTSYMNFYNLFTSLCSVKGVVNNSSSEDLENSLAALIASVSELSATVNDIKEKNAQVASMFESSLAATNELCATTEEAISKNMGQTDQLMKSFEVHKKDVGQLLSSQSALLESMVGELQGEILLRFTNFQHEVHNLLSQTLGEVTALHDQVTDSNDSNHTVILGLRKDMIAKLEEKLEANNQDVRESLSTLLSSMNALSKTLSDFHHDNFGAYENYMEGQLADYREINEKFRNEMTDYFKVVVSVLRDLELHCVTTYKEWVAEAEQVTLKDTGLIAKIEETKKYLDDFDHFVAAFDEHIKNIGILVDKVDEAAMIQGNIISKLPQLDRLDSLLQGQNIALGIQAASDAVKSTVALKESISRKGDSSF